MKNTGAVFPTLIFLVSAAGVLAGGGQHPDMESSDWAGWRGPDGDGISEEVNWDPEALYGGAKILWRTDIGRGYSNVVIVNDRLYTMGSKDKANHVFCLDAQTGSEIWRYSFEHFIIEPQSTPAIAGNCVFALGGEGTLVSLDSTGGNVLWKKHLRSDLHAQSPTTGWATSPVVEGDLLLINANTAAIALNKNTGDLVWSATDEQPIGSWGSYATAFVYDSGGSPVALFMGPSSLNAVDVQTGRKLWSYKHGDTYHPAADPIVSGNRIFVSLPEWCGVLKMTKTVPREGWRSADLTAFTSAVLVGGYLYGSASFEQNVSSWSETRRKSWPFRCLNLSTGAVRWEESMGLASCIAADGKLVILEIDGTLRIAEASPSSFRELSSADVLGGEQKPRLFATSPVLYNGKIYCRNHSGDLVCVDMSK